MRLQAVLVWCAVSAARAVLVGEAYSLPPGFVLKDGQRFDYIVVGAGAGGAPAAARLALAGASVLLVEAGGDPSVLSEIPSAAMSLLGSDIDWQYKTIPNNVSCLSSQGQQCRFSRGKCLGGSTSINYMLYTRGNRRDFADIPAPSWTWDDLQPYFLRSEGLQDLHLLPESSKPFHNTTGPMRIEFFDDPENPWQSRLKKAFKLLGFPENLDVNADSQIGVSQVIGYVHKGKRMSTARGYLGKKSVRETLKVAKNTLCTGVIIDGNNVARGVTVIQGLRKLRVYARREVVLSAGAIGTPHILMLSGIGPAEHLRSMGVTVKVDAPGVGAGMNDHTLPLLLALVDKTTGVNNDLIQLVSRIQYLPEFLIKHSGPVTANGITDITTFLNSQCYDFQQRRLLNVSSDGSSCEIPDLQIIHAYIYKNIVPLTRPLFQRAVGFNDDIVNQISRANERYAIIVISPILLKPYSRGYIRLASSDPRVPPAIYPNYLGDDRDVETLVRAISIMEQLMESKPFKKRNAALLHLELPDCPRVEEDRRGYWACYTRHMTFSVYHAAGTSALGGVLDARLRVRGVRRLRAADLGVMPHAPRGNTAAISMAVGERVADFILEDNKY
ncbi:unnamed protein product [Chrysodeixis includens]|uniref:Glucose-methanol-choline oxidoreductase N-terminal domain-containing protein n=1 Tax=Chrysodeixis includens TaxID=689277 RepID=A0A9P0FUF5_CHRIL|nr:unnamed protein product [Chrysodeixis includens]